MNLDKTKKAFLMVQKPFVNLTKIVRKLGVVKHKKRQEFFSQIIEGVISSRSVNFNEISTMINRDATHKSIERRLQDFFQKVNIDFLQLGALFMGFLTHDKITLSIDRTEWDFGKTQINILCVVASVGKMAVPIYFEMLDNKSGNSNYNDRIDVLKHVIKVVGIERISILVMDREFIGHRWLKWLIKKKIDFVVRVPKNHTLLFADGEVTTAVEILKEQKNFHAENVVIDQVVVNVSISEDASDDMMYLIGSIDSSQLKQTYKKRWTIEVFFQALKSRGFNLEASCLRCIKKYRKLFAIVCLAYTLCWSVGIEDGKKNPVKVKNHGYPAYSVFRRGLNIVRECKVPKNIETLVNVIGNALVRIFGFRSDPQTVG